MVPLPDHVMQNALALAIANAITKIPKHHVIKNFPTLVILELREQSKGKLCLNGNSHIFFSMKSFLLRNFRELSAEEQLNLNGGSGSPCDSGCNCSCKCSCSCDDLLNPSADVYNAFGKDTSKANLQQKKNEIMRRRAEELGY